MRVVIDLQGAQTGSRLRGIGHYALNFALAAARLRGENEVVLALNGAFAEAVESIRAAFADVLPPESIRVGPAPRGVRAALPGSGERRVRAQWEWGQFLRSLVPDVVHVSSVFEGYGDDAVVCVGGLLPQVPVTATLYDLIPLRHPEVFFADRRYQAHYLVRLGELRRVSRLLAISEFVRAQGEELLEMPAGSVVNVSTGLEPDFQPGAASGEALARLGLTGPFVLYVGAGDERKNLRRLVRAWAGVPAALREGVALVFAGGIGQEMVSALRGEAQSCGVDPRELRVLGFVAREDLLALYRGCRLFVFPSWDEGFGLPVLEAMGCGAAVVCADAGSLPEVMELAEGRFDPFDEAAMSAVIGRALGDEALRRRLVDYGVRRARDFSWEATGRRAWAVWEDLGRAEERAARQEDDSFLAPYLASEALATGEAALDGVRAALASVQVTLDEVRQGRQEVQAALQALSARLEAVYTSRSWRWTAPLRRVGAWWRRVRQGGG